MVSFYLSHRAGDKEFVTALIHHALTDRFGADSIFRDTRSLSVGTNFHPEAKRHLEESTALIVVIGPRWLTTDRLWNPFDWVSYEISTALTRRIPVIPVVLDGARMPTDADLPEGIRPLAHHQFRRVHRRTLDVDIPELVNALVSAFGANAEGTWPVIPLILSEEPVEKFPRDSPSRPETAIVYSTHDGRLTVADSGQPMPPRAADGVFTTRYEVDISDRVVLLDGLLPTRDEPYHFRASSTVRFRVTDPAEVVRATLTTDRVPLLDFVLDRSRPITRQFGTDEMAHAEAVVDRRFVRETVAPGGITLLSVSTRLDLDEESRRHLVDQRQRTSELLGDLAMPRLLSRPVRVVARPDPPVLGLPTSSTPDTTRQPERLLVARAPAQVPVGSELSVEVRIVTEGRSTPPDGASAPMPRLLVADDGTPVTVTVHAPAGLHVEGPLQQSVLVEPHEDPAPIRFGFGARTAGRHRVDVTAWAGGTFLAEVSVEVSVADGGSFRDGPPRAASIAAPQARPGEVTMEVRFDGTRYTFQLRSDAALFAPVVESVTNSPNAAVENAIRDLQQVAAGGSRDSAAMTRAVIRSAGIQLWSELVPADVQDQFWEVGSDMCAFTIATDYDVVPWELLYPLSAQRDAGFLVERVPVVRRTYGQRRTSTIGLRNPRFVVPPRAPTGAHEEIAAIRAILGAGDGEPITRADELLALINSGALGVTHFACHNTFSSDGSFIDMDGGRFKPSLLAEASIRRVLADAGPLVFINACRSAGAAPTYTRMLGWAQQFMSSGAGAFVGTLWAVRSESSVRFATAFYQSLAEGATLGAAALAARTDQQDPLLDPTWLAYTVYGDPFATAAV